MRVSRMFLRRYDIEAATAQLRRKSGSVLKRLLGKQGLRLAFIFCRRRGGPLGRGTKEARGSNKVVKEELWENVSGLWVRQGVGRECKLTVPYLCNSAHRYQ